MRNTDRWWKTCVRIAGMNTLAMSIAHFFLPTIFDWAEKLAEVHAIFPWALGVFNFSWSVLLLLISLLVLHIAKHGTMRAAWERLVIGGLGVYWLVHGAYLLQNPPPIPDHLGWIRAILTPFPFVVCALHWIPIWLTRSSKHN